MRRENSLLSMLSFLQGSQQVSQGLQLACPQPLEQQGVGQVSSHTFTLLVTVLPGTQYCSVTHSPHFFVTVFISVTGWQTVFLHSLKQVVTSSLYIVQQTSLQIVSHTGLQTVQQTSL